MTDATVDLDDLIGVIIQAITSAYQTQELEQALVIRDALQRLPNELTTEVINRIMLRLVSTQPDLCRWFILDVFLREANPEGKADVAERINLLMADLKAQQDS
ncbi:MAG: hypothetical protein ACAF41_15830 [Leptolyngbya sp. BL-A-14]